MSLRKVSNSRLYVATGVLIALESVESDPTSRRNISPPSSGPKNTPSKIPVQAGAGKLRAGLLLALLISPEDEDDEDFTFKRRLTFKEYSVLCP
jgi:hypothetical protein